MAPLCWHGVNMLPSSWFEPRRVGTGEAILPSCASWAGMPISCTPSMTGPHTVASVLAGPGDACAHTFSRSAVDCESRQSTVEHPVNVSACRDNAMCNTTAGRMSATASPVHAVPPAATPSYVREAHLGDVKRHAHPRRHGSRLHDRTLEQALAALHDQVRRDGPRARAFAEQGDHVGVATEAAARTGVDVSTRPLAGPDTPPTYAMLSCTHIMDARWSSRP